MPKLPASDATVTRDTTHTTNTTGQQYVVRIASSNDSLILCFYQFPSSAIPMSTTVSAFTKREYKLELKFPIQ